MISFSLDDIGSRSAGNGAVFLISAGLMNYLMAMDAFDLAILDMHMPEMDGLEFQADPAEKRDYDAAMDVFRKGDFAAAQASLQRFVQRYPQTGYMPSALFWLGNASYAIKDYKGSLAQFRQMLNLSSTHARAPEAMLAISNVQIELKDTKAARKTLEDLIKAYPQSDAAQAARDRLPKLR